jgi:hypothetical protein
MSHSKCLRAGDRETSLKFLASIIWASQFLSQLCAIRVTKLGNILARRLFWKLFEKLGDFFPIFWLHCFQVHNFEKKKIKDIM